MNAPMALGIAPDRCELFTDAFSKLIQLVLGFVAIGSLWIKRELEHPKRDFGVWALDVSKQATGGFFIHVLNIILSVVFAMTSSAQADECGVYFCTFLIDVTVGTFIVWYLLRQSEQWAIYKNWRELENTGNYGTPVNLNIWKKQLGVWLLIILIMKVIITGIVWLFFPLIRDAGTFLFQRLEDHRHFELVLVMIIGPGLMNLAQFWVQDSFMKDRTPTIKVIYPKDIQPLLHDPHPKVNVDPEQQQPQAS